jgi:divalent metal cation (Fe/Co/Zn/Cd) transporter
LVRKSLAGLLDEADIELINEVLKSLNKIRKPVWIDIHNLRAVKHGAMIHIDCHITLPFYLSLKQTHDQLKLLEYELNYEFNNRLEIFIHPDPCEFTSCNICQVTYCTYRKFDFLEKVNWSANNVLLNTKHKI